MILYCPSVFEGIKACIHAGLRGGVCLHPAPLFAYGIPLLFAVSLFSASCRTIHPVCLSNKSCAADDTRARFRAPACKGFFQRYVEGQHRPTKIPAIRAHPILTEHIAVAVEGQTAIFAVVVGAHGNNELADRGAFRAGQLPLYAIRHGRNFGSS